MAALTMSSSSAVDPSPFSFYNDSPSSPTSSKDSHEKDFAPQSTTLGAPTSPYPQTVEPSPVDSNGTASTDTTEIDETPQEQAHVRHQSQTRDPAVNPVSPGSQLGKLDTALSGSPAPDEETNPQSVIHVSDQFRQFSVSRTAPPAKPSRTSSPSDRSGHTVLSPTSPKPSPEPSASVAPANGDHLNSETNGERKETSTSPLRTDLPSAPFIDRSTPQAQTVAEAEQEWQRRKSLNVNLANIPETSDAEPPSTDPTGTNELAENSQTDVHNQREDQQQTASLQTALSECWTLCTTFADLSSNHRNHIFTYRGQSSVQEQAWRSCWRLCQSLYENRAEDQAGLLLPTLELCREFCQALFDARLKGDEVSDSVLRVSFELNNHLYNTHDRNLPSAFQERTLDFYLTLCHRLMKQRTSLPPETDALLRACWNLAEMLFSLRQNAYENGGEDEELLSSAVQACWDLGDLFREGWTQARPSTGTDRGTPRAPHQTMSSFSPTGNSIRSNSLFSSRSPSVTRSSSSHSYNPAHGDLKPFPPETPTTIFEDMNESPLGADDGNVPNILVLGPEQAGAHANRNRWADSASTLSGYTESSQRTSSTATAPGQSSATAANLTKIRVLLLRAAYTAGFKPRSASQGSADSPSTGPTSLTVTSPKTLGQQNEALITFIRDLPVTAFGLAPWQKGIVENYKKFIVAWPAIIRSSVSTVAIMKGDGTPIRELKNGNEEVTRVAATVITTGSAETRTTALEIAGAVRWMCRKPSNSWLVDLHRAVFGTGVEDAVAQTAVIVG